MRTYPDRPHIHPRIHFLKTEHGEKPPCLAEEARPFQSLNRPLANRPIETFCGDHSLNSRRITRAPERAVTRSIVPRPLCVSFASRRGLHWWENKSVSGKRMGLRNEIQVCPTERLGLPLLRK